MSRPLEPGRVEIRPMRGIEQLEDILNCAALLARRVRAAQPADSDLHQLAEELEERLERFNTSGEAPKRAVAQPPGSEGRPT